jgi:hypothetical protein
MATILMLVGEECEIDAGAQLLVHGPSGGTEGTVADMQSGLKMLTNEHEALRDIYVARTGQPEEAVEEWMSKDAFFTAKEALAVGPYNQGAAHCPQGCPGSRRCVGQCPPHLLCWHRRPRCSAPGRAARQHAQTQS